MPLKLSISMLQPVLLTLQWTGATGTGATSTLASSTGAGSTGDISNVLQEPNVRNTVLVVPWYSLQCY